MGKKKTDIQIKKEKQEVKLAQLQAALAKAKKQEKRNQTESRKRKTPDMLARYLNVPLAGRNALRTSQDYAAKTYNLSRQVVGLIDHIYGNYPVPDFLYRSLLSLDGMKLVYQLDYVDRECMKEAGKAQYVRWFMIVAQGGSLAKELKNVLTKKEAHWFLQAPAHNSIGRNLFWAKCVAGGVSVKVAQFLTEMLGGKSEQKTLGERADDLIRFYAREHSLMGERELREITDFVRTIMQDPRFCFKGRTYGSMLTLSNEWHRRFVAGNVAVLRTWSQSFAGWSHKKKDFWIYAIELTSNRALADEGRRQRHCVYSYTESCLKGWSKIVSIRWILPSDRPIAECDVQQRLTVEISPKSQMIVQIRGQCNRKASGEEMKVVRLWAGEHGLKICPYADA